MFEETLVFEQWRMLHLQSSSCAECRRACGDDGSYRQTRNGCRLTHLQGRRDTKKAKLILDLDTIWK
jgi:hypothetical protein